MNFDMKLVGEGPALKAPDTDEVKQQAKTPQGEVKAGFRKILENQKDTGESLSADETGVSNEAAALKNKRAGATEENFKNILDAEQANQQEAFNKIDPDQKKPASKEKEEVFVSKEEGDRSQTKGEPVPIASVRKGDTLEVPTRSYTSREKDPREGKLDDGDQLRNSPLKTSKISPHDHAISTIRADSFTITHGQKSTPETADLTTADASEQAAIIPSEIDEADIFDTHSLDSPTRLGHENFSDTGSVKPSLQINASSQNVLSEESLLTQPLSTQSTQQVEGTFSELPKPKKDTPILSATNLSLDQPGIKEPPQKDISQSRHEAKLELEALTSSKDMNVSNSTLPSDLVTRSEAFIDVPEKKQPLIQDTSLTSQEQVPGQKLKKEPSEIAAFAQTNTEAKIPVAEQGSSSSFREDTPKEGQDHSFPQAEIKRESNLENSAVQSRSFDVHSQNAPSKATFSHSEDRRSSFLTDRANDAHMREVNPKHKRHATSFSHTERSEAVFDQTTTSSDSGVTSNPSTKDISFIETTASQRRDAAFADTSGFQRREAQLIDTSGSQRSDAPLADTPAPQRRDVPLADTSGIQRRDAPLVDTSGSQRRDTNSAQIERTHVQHHANNRHQETRHISTNTTREPIRDTGPSISQESLRREGTSFANADRQYATATGTNIRDTSQVREMRPETQPLTENRAAPTKEWRDDSSQVRNYYQSPRENVASDERKLPGRVDDIRIRETQREALIQDVDRSEEEIPLDDEADLFSDDLILVGADKTETRAELYTALAQSPLLATNHTSSTESTAKANPQMMAELVVEMVQQISQVNFADRTETLVTLQHPPLFDGAQIMIREFKQASGEFSISFHGLSPEAAALLIERTNQRLLQEGFERRGLTVHILQVTQAPVAETYFTSGEQSGTFGENDREGGNKEEQGSDSQKDRRQR